MIIAATSVAVVFPFFLLGILAGHDFTFHMNSWMEVFGQWKQGICYPRWAAMAHYGYGEARFIFYPPASWMLGAALGLVLPWKLVPGAYVWMALTLSGCSMFALARRWLDYRAAIVAAVLYAINPYYLVIVYWRSDFSELLAGALLPLFLMFVLRLEEGRASVVGLGLIVAGVWLTNAPAGLMVNYSATLLLIMIAAIRRSYRVLVAGAAALVLGGLLAAGYILPAAYEQAWVNISQAFAKGFRPQDNFLFTTIDNPGHDAFNRLLSMVSVCEMVVLAAAVGYARPWRHVQRDAFWALAAWAGAAALLMFSVTAVFWTYLPLLRFLQFPWRWLLCLNVAFALLVARAWRSRLVGVVICVGMVAMLLFGAWRIQRPWKATAADIARMGDRQRKGEGYKGRPEYVPVGVDVDGIKESADAVTLEGDGQARINLQQWNAESRAFTVNAAQPGNLVVRLFNYPAWRAEVNGRVVRSETKAVSGQLIIPVQRGENRIRIWFRRTWDRTLGGMISAGAFLTLVFDKAFRRLRQKSV